jgi:hypothetical protein
MKPAQHGFELNYIIDGTQTVFIEPLHLGKDASFGARSIVDKEISHWTLDPVDPCKGWKTTLGENIGARIQAVCLGEKEDMQG